MRNLCMAHELAVEAILAERPDAIIVQGESIEHFHRCRDAARSTQADRMERHQASVARSDDGPRARAGHGAYLNEHGVTSNDLSFFRERRAVGQRWLGVDYYPTLRAPHRVDGPPDAPCRTPMGFGGSPRVLRPLPGSALSLRDESGRNRGRRVAGRAVGRLMAMRTRRHSGHRLHLVLADRPDRLAARAAGGAQRPARRSACTIWIDG